MEVMKITLRVASDGLMHVDSLDLYKDNERKKFIERANEEVLLDKTLIKRDLARIIMMLESEQERRIYNTSIEEEKAIEITKEDKEQALAFLKDKSLLNNIEKSFLDIGLVGSEINKMTAYLALVSRKLSKPLSDALGGKVVSAYELPQYVF